MVGFGSRPDAKTLGKVCGGDRYSRLMKELEGHEIKMGDLRMARLELGNRVEEWKMEQRAMCKLS